MKTYYGSETKRALENFPFSYHAVQREFIYAIVEIKKAAAVANEVDGGISRPIRDAIVRAADEVISGQFDDQFVTTAIQGGAGTSINMNVNEVLAARASDLLKNKQIVHPLDHVNKSQSTNDVNPSALKIAVLRLLDDLTQQMSVLEGELRRKSKEFSHIPKLGRTHLQDAVPMTMGSAFGSYTSLVSRHIHRAKNQQPYLLQLNLGGTAIGNSINASATYRSIVYKELAKQVGFELKPADNLMSQTSSQSDFVAVSHMLSAYLVDVSKIANDIRIMTSGPKGGFAELKLPELQKGSSIMPGKVNPVIPEVVNQVFYWVTGQGVTVQMAARGAQFELANMLPVVADVLIQSLRMTTEATLLFATRCVSDLKVDEDNCRRHLEESTAYATLLTPKLGYDTISMAVKQAIATEKTMREVIVDEMKLLTQKEFDTIVQQEIT